MPATHKGEAVTVLRPVDPGDPAFVVDGGEQLLIRKSDGTECVVVKKDVSDGPDVVIDTMDETPVKVVAPKDEPLIPKALFTKTVKKETNNKKKR